MINMSDKTLTALTITYSFPEKELKSSIVVICRRLYNFGGFNGDVLYNHI